MIYETGWRRWPRLLVRRVRTAIWLAWSALRGRTVTIAVASFDLNDEFVGVPIRHKKRS